MDRYLLLLSLKKSVDERMTLFPGKANMIIGFEQGSCLPAIRLLESLQDLLFAWCAVSMGDLSLCLLCLCRNVGIIFWISFCLGVLWQDQHVVFADTEVIEWWPSAFSEMVRWWIVYLDAQHPFILSWTACAVSRCCRSALRYGSTNLISSVMSRNIVDRKAHMPCQRWRSGPVTLYNNLHWHQDYMPAYVVIASSGQPALADMLTCCRIRLES